MRSPAALKFTVGRSRFQAGLLILLGLTGIVMAALWRDEDGVFGWRQACFVVSFIAAWVVAAMIWRRSPVGKLGWDGQTWNWQAETEQPCAELQVHLDLQVFLLVSIVLDGGCRLWLWPERAADAAQWLALRRAVHFSATKPA